MITVVAENVDLSIQGVNSRGPQFIVILKTIEFTENV